MYYHLDSQGNLFHDHGCCYSPQTVFIYLFIIQHIFMESLVKNQVLRILSAPGRKMFVSQKIHILLGQDKIDEQTNVECDGTSLEICEQGVA